MNNDERFKIQIGPDNGSKVFIAITAEELPSVIKAAQKWLKDRQKALNPD